MFRCLNYFVVLIFGTVLSACATVDYDAFNSKLTSGESSGIAAQFDGKNTSMSLATLRLRNSTEGIIYTRTFNAHHPSVVEVKPGKYSILSGSTSGYNVSGNLPLIGAWYKEFEVGPGEIVNIGKFGYKPFDVESSADSTAGKVWNALNSLGMSTKHLTNYVTYHTSAIDDAELNETLEKNFPANKSKLVSRPLEMRLSDDEFQKIVIEAAAPNEDGKLPTLEESRERINEALSKYIFDTLIDEKSASISP